MSTQCTDGMIYRERDADTVPALGFGTWQLKGDECREALNEALAAGYRHVDTAQAYENEGEIGETLEASGVPREDVFLTTKIWVENLDREGVHRSFEESLRKLRTPYVDLLLIHWDNEDVPMEETLEAMNILRDAGKVKHVGVSNFTVPKLEKAVACSKAPLFADQIEYHPFLAERPIRAFCREHGILVTAYCPIARGEVMENSILKEIGDTYGKSPAQITLRWLLQQDDVIAIPKSGTPEHIRQNFDVFDFELVQAEMDRISALDRNERIIDPDFAPDWNAV